MPKRTLPKLNADIGQQIFDAAPVGMALVAKDFRILRANPAYCRFFGYSERQLRRMTIRQLTHPADWPISIKAIRKVWSPGATDMPPVEKRFIRKDRAVVWGHVHARIVRDSSGKALFAIAQLIDITAVKRAEEALRKAHDELEGRVRDRTAKLRALAIQLDQAEQQERRKMAQVLHDDLQQILVGARFALSGIRMDGSAETRRKTVEQVDASLASASDMTRSLCLDLHPPVLFDTGVATALRWLAEDMWQKYGFQVRLALTVTAQPFTAMLNSFVFNAVRELLFNVVKHARVKEADVRLKIVDDNWSLIEVRDAGAGFDPDQIKPTSFGLFSIRERVDHLGGTMKVHSAPGKGCCVSLKLPRL